MNIDVGKLIKNVSQIKLKGGIFSKASTVIIVISICIFAIAALTKNLWVSVGAIALIFTLTFVILWRLINFANKNPQAAILEGAEFLVHEQIQLAAKGIGTISSSLSNVIEETPVLLDEESQKIAELPDEENQIEKKEENG
jgi:hypothetical protein